MTATPVPAPSVKLTSFACPHCGAHATQHWYRGRLGAYPNKAPTPLLPDPETVKQFEANTASVRNQAGGGTDDKILNHLKRLLEGGPFIGDSGDSDYYAPWLENVFISRCYTCHRLAIWLHDRLLYPPAMMGPAPNPDLSEDVLRDYEEARSILDLSPRGAAALLRLAVEKICIELGATGKDINERIGDLVANGLPAQVQKALDAVRVIGNEAVHPGQMDLRDDRDTASKLFALVNFIAEDRISRPKHIDSIYGMVPDAKREGIERRDAKPATP